MFINRSVLDLVKLIELTLKDHEITSRLRIQVDNIALELFNSINNFQEVLMSKEELEVFLINFFDDLFNRIKVSILIEELLQILMRVFLQLKSCWLFFGDNLSSKSILLHDLTTEDPDLALETSSHP